MCLKTIDLNLKENKEGEITGFGYKAIHKDDPYSLYRDLLLWQTAMINLAKLSCTDVNEGMSPTTGLITSENGLLYKVGFHIFLRKEDAYNYGYAYQRDEWTIYKVEFKNVTGFGQNTIYGVSPQETRPCVIAQNIRYLGKA